MSCCDTVEIRLQTINGKRQVGNDTEWIRAHKYKYLKVYNPDGSLCTVYVRRKPDIAEPTCSMCALAGPGPYWLIRKQICRYMLGCLSETGMWEKSTAVMEEL
jgi:hypothetical protein